MARWGDGLSQLQGVRAYTAKVERAASPLHQHQPSKKSGRGGTHLLQTVSPHEFRQRLPQEQQSGSSAGSLERVWKPSSLALLTIVFYSHFSDLCSADLALFQREMARALTVPA